MPNIVQGLRKKYQFLRLKKLNGLIMKTDFFTGF